MHIGSSLADGDAGLPSVYWLKDEEFTLNGQLFKLKNLREMLKAKLESANTLLRSKVMKGISPESLLPKVEAIVDNLKNIQEGYSFLSDSHNPFYKVTMDFSKALIADAHWGPIFGHSKKGEFVWDYDAVTEWLEHVKQFKEVLFLLIHITSGLPPRGTEATETLICNTTTARRNMYAVGGRPCLISSYNKTSHNSHHDKLLPRGLQEMVGDLFINYLALVRPLESVVAHQVVEEKHLHLYRTHLWVGPKGRWDTRGFNKILEREFNKHMKMEMSVGTWRHAATAIMRRHLVKQLDKQPEIQHDLLEAMATEQAGHTSAISNLNYAVEVLGFDALPERKLKLFILVRHPFILIMTPSNTLTDQRHVSIGAAPQNNEQGGGVRSTGLGHDRKSPLTSSTIPGFIFRNHGTKLWCTAERVP
jgi:hypothetical protein